MQKIKEYLGESKEVEFPTCWSKDETLFRLSQLTKWKPGSPPIFGEVSISRVKLRLTRPFNRSNGTAFCGQIEVKGDRILLVGRFVASAFYRFVGSMFLVFVTFMLCGGVFGSISHVVNSDIHFPQAIYFLGGLSIYVIGCLSFAALIIRNIRPDQRVEEILAHAIQSALSNKPPDLLAEPRVFSKARLVIWAGILALFGIALLEKQRIFSLIFS